MVPTGTVTFLFTDIQGSTKLWERHPKAMGLALARHDSILQSICSQNSGFVFKTVGDAFCVAFDTASGALQAAIDIQRALAAEPWGETGPLRVRMALHVGAAEFRDDDYFGNALNRVARILAAAHGGQVILSHPAEELVRDSLPEGVQLQDLGECRLKDLARPERIFQARIDGLPCDFPPLRSLATVANNLPAQLSSFVGRERELFRVRGLLTSARLITLTGTGGTGKTRLAIEAARSGEDAFPDGIWFVELALLSDPSRVPESVANTLGLREDPDIPTTDLLREFLADRSLLLVMDNCEHVLEATANLLASLLKACPNLSILATSRHSLGIAGETTLAVPPLATINPRRDLFQVADIVSTVSQSDAVRLFIDRAAMASPSFKVTAENAPDIAQICWSLDGIPLAIELAAARAKVLTAAQISARLADRFRLLTGGNRSGLPHQQTLRALIDWSYELLSESERILFRRMGVFGGGRSLEAIEAVCSGDGVDDFDVLDLVQQLADKSLLTVEEHGPGDSRYTMIESVWQYARDRLETSGELPRLQDLHLAYYLKLADEIRPCLEGPHLAEALERVDAERNNFRLALAHAEESGSDHVQDALRILGNLIRYYEVRGNLKEARARFDATLALPGAEQITAARGRALAAAGRIAWIDDRNEAADKFYHEATDVFRAIGDDETVAITETFHGFVRRIVGDIDDAEARFRRAVELGFERRDVKLTAIGLSGLGTVATDRGDPTAGRRYKEESLAVFRESGDKWVTGYILWGIAKVCVADGDAPAARTALIEWLELVRELGNRWALPHALQAIGDLLQAEGAFASAARIYGAAESAREALGVRLDATDQREWDVSIEKLKSRLPASTLEEEWKSGRRMTAWDAVDYAFDEPTPVEAVA